MEGAMNSFLHGLIAVLGQVSFAWTVLFVVCFACVLAVVLEATIDIVVSIIALGCLTAMAEHAMHDRNSAS
jgi:hypothetical protein